MHKATVTGTVQVLKNVVAGSGSGEGRHVASDGQKIFKRRTAHARTPGMEVAPNAPRCI